MYRCGDKVLIKVGNGIMTLPGRIISEDGNNTYSVYVNKKIGTVGYVKKEDINLVKKIMRVI